MGCLPCPEGPGQVNIGGQCMCMPKGSTNPSDAYITPADNGRTCCGGTQSPGAPDSYYQDGKCMCMPFNSTDPNDAYESFFVDGSCCSGQLVATSNDLCRC